MAKKPYPFTPDTVRHLCNNLHYHKLDPNRLTRDHQLVVAHYGDSRGIDHLLGAKKLHHDTKFMVARYGDLDQLHLLMKRHQPLDARTTKQLKSSAKMYTGDNHEYHTDGGLEHAQKLWKTVGVKHGT